MMYYLTIHTLLRYYIVYLMTGIQFFLAAPEASWPGQEASLLILYNLFEFNIYEAIKKYFIAYNGIKRYDM